MKTVYDFNSVLLTGQLHAMDSEQPQEKLSFAYVQLAMGLQYGNAANGGQAVNAGSRGVSRNSGCSMSGLPGVDMENIRGVRFARPPPRCQWRLFGWTSDGFVEREKSLVASYTQPRGLGRSSAWRDVFGRGSTYLAFEHSPRAHQKRISPRINTATATNETEAELSLEVWSTPLPFTVPSTRRIRVLTGSMVEQF